MVRRLRRAAQDDHARRAPRNLRGAQLSRRRCERAYGAAQRRRRDLRDIVAADHSNGAGGGDCVRCEACAHN